MKYLVLVIVLAAFSTSAFAEGYYKNVNELRLVRAISVYTEDQVKDGCLSNPNILKVEAEPILRRSGISLSQSDPYFEGRGLAFFAALGPLKKLIEFRPKGILILFGVGCPVPTIKHAPMMVEEPRFTLLI